MGKAMESGGVVHLEFEGVVGEMLGWVLGRELYPSRWGERAYLIPKHELIRFCNAVSAGIESPKRSGGLFLVREGDRDRPATGLPPVPPAYRPYLLKAPIEATDLSASQIESKTGIGGAEFKDWTVRINQGSAAGLLKGMELYPISEELAFESMEVVELDENTSTCRLVFALEELPKPQSGWRYSTRPRWITGD
jgi:hypothetical protein